MPAFSSERRHTNGDRRSGRDRRMIVDAGTEEAYWRANFKKEIYYEKGLTYDDYHAAYRTGWEGRARHRGKTFEEVERELQADYNRNRAGSRLGWDRGKHAALAAWERFAATEPFERSQ